MQAATPSAEHADGLGPSIAATCSPARSSRQGTIGRRVVRNPPAGLALELAGERARIHSTRDRHG